MTDSPEQKPRTWWRRYAFGMDLDARDRAIDEAIQVVAKKLVQDEIRSVMKVGQH